MNHLVLCNFVAHEESPLSQGEH